MRVVLTGFMGTGKSAVGRRVAERLGRALIDTDAVIERNEGAPVRDIFARFGQAHFRELERRVVAEACAAGDVVIATGGGTIIDEDNRRALGDAGLMVCLNATPQVIARRVRASAASRPMLAGASGLTARIRELLAERQPVYSGVPIQIDTTKLSVEQVADTVIAALSDAESTGARGVARAGQKPAAGRPFRRDLPERSPSGRRTTGSGIVAP
jgi:shikimate kinase